MAFAFLPILGAQHTLQNRPELGGALQPREGRAEPFGVGDLGSLGQKAQPHQVAYQPRRH